VEVNEADVRRVERVARSGKDWTVAFPRLSQIRAEFQGEGQEILVRFNKTEGAPVRFVAADDPTEAAAIREIDLQRRFRYSATESAKQIGLTTNKSAVLKRYCKTDADPQCMHEFAFGSQKHNRYSDTAIEVRHQSHFAADTTNENQNFSSTPVPLKCPIFYRIKTHFVLRLEADSCHTAFSFVTAVNRCAPSSGSSTSLPAAF
jgi:hypothetical protein